MAMHINNVTIPTSIANRGKYKFTPPEIVARNGLGEPVEAGYSKIEWRFSYMPFADFDWWQTTLLTGLRWKRFTTCQFVADTRLEVAYTNCIVFRPTYENIYSNWYENAVVTIEQIM